jgi:hypothetical protein
LKGGKFLVQEAYLVIKGKKFFPALCTKDDLSRFCDETFFMSDKKKGNNRFYVTEQGLAKLN